MQILRNPLNKKIEIQYRGQPYEIEAKGYMRFDTPEKKEAGEYWRTRIHQFLVLDEEENLPTSQAKEETPEEDEVKETEEKEEEKATVAAPKKATANKAKDKKPSDQVAKAREMLSKKINS